MYSWGRVAVSEASAVLVTVTHQPVLLGEVLRVTATGMLWNATDLREIGGGKVTKQSFRVTDQITIYLNRSNRLIDFFWGF